MLSFSKATKDLTSLIRCSLTLGFNGNVPNQPFVNLLFFGIKSPRYISTNARLLKALASCLRRLYSDSDA